MQVHAPREYIGAYNSDAVGALMGAACYGPARRARRPPETGMVSGPGTFWSRNDLVSLVGKERVPSGCSLACRFSRLMQTACAMACRCMHAALRMHPMPLLPDTLCCGLWAGCPSNGGWWVLWGAVEWMQARHGCACTGMHVHSSCAYGAGRQHSPALALRTGAGASWAVCSPRIAPPAHAQGLQGYCRACRRLQPRPCRATGGDARAGTPLC